MNRVYRNHYCQCSVHSFVKTCTRCHITFRPKVAHHHLCRSCFRANPPVPRPVIAVSVPLPVVPQPRMTWCKWCYYKYDLNVHSYDHCVQCRYKISCFVNDDPAGTNKPDFWLRAVYIRPYTASIDANSDGDNGHLDIPYRTLSKTKIVTFQFPTWMSRDDFDDTGKYVGDTYIFDQVNVMDDDLPYMFRHAFLQHCDIVDQAFK